MHLILLPLIMIAMAIAVIWYAALICVWLGTLLIVSLFALRDKARLEWVPRLRVWRTQRSRVHRIRQAKRMKVRIDAAGNVTFK